MARPRSAPRQTTALAAVLLAWTATAAAEVRLATSLEDTTGGTRRLYYLDLGSGATFEADPKRSGRRLEVKRLEQNLFEEIGRRDLPAAYGDFLLAPLHDGNGRSDRALLIETETGFAAVLDRLGKQRRLAEISVLPGRPTAAVATDDANYALLAARDSSGRTEAAYLYHGTSGRCAALLGLGERQELESETCSDLPRLASVQAAPLVSGSGQTRAWVVVDGESGEVVRVRPNSGNPLRLTASEVLYDLDRVFPESSGTAGRRFALLALSADDQVGRVLVFDMESGRAAVLEIGSSGGSADATSLGVDLYDSLLPPERPRVLTLTARQTSSGETEAVWIFDSATNRILLLDSPASPTSARLQAVEILD